MKELAIAEVKDKVTETLTTSNPHKICIDKIKAKIYSRSEDKYYVVFTKGMVQSNFYTLPYGYCAGN